MASSPRPSADSLPAASSTAARSGGSASTPRSACAASDRDGSSPASERISRGAKPQPRPLGRIGGPERPVEQRSAEVLPAAGPGEQPLELRLGGGVPRRHRQGGPECRERPVAIGERPGKNAREGHERAGPFCAARALGAGPERLGEQGCGRVAPGDREPLQVLPGLDVAGLARDGAPQRTLGPLGVPARDELSRRPPRERARAGEVAAAHGALLERPQAGDGVVEPAEPQRQCHRFLQRGAGAVLVAEGAAGAGGLVQRLHELDGGGRVRGVDGAGLLEPQLLDLGPQERHPVGGLARPGEQRAGERGVAGLGARRAGPAQESAGAAPPAADPARVLAEAPDGAAAVGVDAEAPLGGVGVVGAQLEQPIEGRHGEVRIARFLGEVGERGEPFGCLGLLEGGEPVLEERDVYRERLLHGAARVEQRGERLAGEGGQRGASVRGPGRAQRRGAVSLGAGEERGLPQRRARLLGVGGTGGEGLERLAPGQRPHGRRYVGSYAFLFLRRRIRPGRNPRR